MDAEIQILYEKNIFLSVNNIQFSLYKIHTFQLSKHFSIHINDLIEKNYYSSRTKY